MAAFFGARLRRGAGAAAVAAVVVAALSASGAPGATDRAAAGDDRRAGSGDVPAPAETPSVTGDSSYYTDLPPLQSPSPEDGPDAEPRPGERGIPDSLLEAYRKAEKDLADSRPGCHVPWQLLAAIGKVESGHARGGRVDRSGTTLTPVLGPVLDGKGFARITDTDGGTYDGDTVHDRAVGPMQFIPSTWATWGSDGNGDAHKDPNNVYDAALAAARYLCAGDRDLSVESDLHSAILGYNHSRAYLRTVLSWYEYYRTGSHSIPDGSGPSLPMPTPGQTPGSGTGPGKGSGKPAESEQPGQPDRPDAPGKPGKDDPEKPDPDEPRPGDPGEPEPGTPAPADSVARLVAVPGKDLAADTGADFTERVSVVARDKKGAVVPKAPVRFEVIGTTGTEFAGGRKTVTVTTDARGTASAPALRAGERAGDFTVRVTVPGRELAPVDRAGKVNVRQADSLVRADGEGAPQDPQDVALTCEVNGALTEKVQILAGRAGAAAAGVALTAVVEPVDGEPGTPAEGGPYFEDAEGEPVRTLDTLKTDAKGLLTLPELFAGGEPGEYRLRLTAPGGGELLLEITVTAAGESATSPGAPGSG